MDNRIKHIRHPDHMLVLHDQWTEQKKPIGCKVCSKPLLPGSAYYVCEKSDCKFIVHESCSKLPVPSEEMQDGAKAEKNQSSESNNDSGGSAAVAALDSKTEQKLEAAEKAVNENDPEANLAAKRENNETEQKHDKKNGETSNVEVKDDAVEKTSGDSKRKDNKKNKQDPSSTTNPTAKKKSEQSHHKENNTSNQDEVEDEWEDDEWEDDDWEDDESEDDESEDDKSEDGIIKDSDGPRFSDLGGLRSVLDELTMEVIVHLNNPLLLSNLGMKQVSGILLHGPSGCGKTKLAHAIANETALPFHYISCNNRVFRKFSSAKKKIENLFAKAYSTAPSIVFIDEIHKFVKYPKMGPPVPYPKMGQPYAKMEQQPSLVTTLLTCMDESNSKSSDSTTGQVFVIGATNRIESLDPDLRKSGRFDREIVIKVPDEDARIDILSMLTRNMILDDSVDLGKISSSTSEFVGADLEKLVNEARTLAIRRIIDKRKSEMSKDYNSGAPIGEWWKQPHWLPKYDETENLCIHMADFEEAIKMVQPPSKKNSKVNGCFPGSLFGPKERELSVIPDVKWEDVGGLDSLRKEFNRYIIRRIKHPELYEKFGMDLDTGFLLHGPPGCGKTLIAKAVANEAGANFIHIKGPEIFNCLFGESEQAIRKIFSKARASSPCIVFFDEVDSLTVKRGSWGNSVRDTILNQLLIELDGGDKRKGVFVIGATNRREAVDGAALRPGRLGKSMYVPLPDADGRESILKALSRKKPVDASVDFHAIARMKACEKLSGADLAALVNEAAMAALEENLDSCSNSTTPTINATHFEQALQKIKPSV